ncbi:MAG TPA: M13 family metallopeptidase [Methanocorpusculum sp.]|nr:M13 family metallopeptidase [Methanocorpusculum sp.]
MNSSLKKYAAVLFAAAVLLTAVFTAGCVSSVQPGYENAAWFNTDIVENTMDETQMAQETFLYKDNFYNAVNKESVMMGSDLKMILNMMNHPGEADMNQSIALMKSPLFVKLGELMSNPSVSGQMGDALSNPESQAELREMMNETMDTNSMLGMLVTMLTPLNMGQLTVNEQLTGIAADTSLQGHEAEVIRAFQKISSDGQKRNLEGTAPVIPYVNEIKAVSTLDELTKLIGTGGAASLKEAFIREEIAGSLSDGTVATVHLSPGRFSLNGDAGLYKSMSAESAEQYERIITSFTKFLVSCGFSEEEAAKTAAEFKKLETEIAQVCYAKDAEQSMAGYYDKVNNPVTFEELQMMNFPAAADLQVYADAGAKSFSITNPKWLEKLNSLYTEENLEGFKAMMLYSLYAEAASHLDSASGKLLMDAASNTLMDKIQSSSGVIADADKNRYLGMAIGKYYTEKYTTPEMKQNLTDLTHQIISVYKERINKADWLSNSSKKGAIEKLDNLKLRILYPEDWSYYSYGDVDTSRFDSLLNATIELKKHNQNQLVKNAVHAPSENIWPQVLADNVFIVPQTVNAFYNPGDNSINIMAGFANVVYNPETESEEEMLSVVGTTIAHEISHGLDPLGSKFDKDGSYKNWWTVTDKAKFDAKVAAAARYYSGFEVKPGVYLKGSQYTGEVIADLGGFSVILDIASEIDGFDYQKFFTKYAKTMYSPYIDELYTNFVLTDVHPPHMYRVNANLQQYDEFLNAFNVTEGDMMYLPKDKRITVW